VSFRARLTVAAAVAVAVAVAAAAAVAYVAVENQLRGQVDDSLTSRATAIESALSRNPGLMVFPTSKPRQFFGHLPNVPFGDGPGCVQLVAADAVVRDPDESCVLPVLQRDRTVAERGTSSSFRDATVDGYHLRVLTAAVGSGYALQVARPLTEVDHTLSHLRLLLLLVVLGGIGIAGGLGLLVTRTAIAPVRRLTRATEHVTETQDLDSRIETGGRRDELSRLAFSFNTMLEALDRSLKAQRQLVADASHELRTPLTSLRTNVEVLQRDPDMPDEERRRILADVLEQAGELTGLVTELVELARGEQQEHRPEDVRLDLVVSDAVERARRNWPGVSFETKLDESLVHGVPAGIDRAVSNLLDNAAKWSPAGGTVDVQVQGSEVVVRDRGPGIADSDLPHVFDRFYRAPSARGMPGSGLGLAIVRQVAESHGGTIAAERPRDGGTLMRLKLSSNGSRPDS
jgi:two-component system sensor histidine kinase MprB